MTSFKETFFNLRIWFSVHCFRRCFYLIFLKIKFEYFVFLLWIKPLFVNKVFSFWCFAVGIFSGFPQVESHIPHNHVLILSPITHDLVSSHFISSNSLFKDILFLFLHKELFQGILPFYCLFCCNDSLLVATMMPVGTLFYFF